MELIYGKPFGFKGGGSLSSPTKPMEYLIIPIIVVVLIATLLKATDIMNKP